jgi:hypothetical protein
MMWCCVAVLTAGLGACGSSDDDAGSIERRGGDELASENGTGAGGGLRPAADGTPQQRIAAAYGEFTQALRSDRYEDACGVFSNRFRRRYPVTIGFDGACAPAMRAEFSSYPSSRPKPQMIKVKIIDSRTATGFVKSGPDSKNLLPLRFVKQGGSWKMDGAAKAS